MNETWSLGQARLRSSNTPSQLSGLPSSNVPNTDFSNPQDPPATTMNAVQHFSLCSPRNLVIGLPILIIVCGILAMPGYTTPSVFSANGVIIGSGLIALSWALLNFLIIRNIPVRSCDDVDLALISDDLQSHGIASNGNSSNDRSTQRLLEVYHAIYIGAESFLRAEYKVCLVFIVLFSPVIFFLTAWGTGWDFVRGAFTTISFVLGALTSMLSGYLGMKVAVFSNVRTTISAQRAGYTACFNTAFRAGAVMGFAVVGLGILVLYVTMLAFRRHYPAPSDWVYLTETITGFGLGGSCIAMVSTNLPGLSGLRFFRACFGKD